MTITKISENKLFGGTQGVYSHQSNCCRSTMKFAVYVPPQASKGPVPVLYWLSGLTCTEENFIFKAGAQRYAAEAGLILVAPDTSPRVNNIAGSEDAFDFGSGAGFYLNATQPPWAENYQMYSYITEELPMLIIKEFPTRPDRLGVFGHSMGGHGALTIALRNPEACRSVSAFAPICAPTQSPWGQKCLKGYLGDDPQSWQQYDATELMKSGRKFESKILIDQGQKDEFLSMQLKPELFEQACAAQGQEVEIRMQEGYDHSYYFISTFMADHIRHHAEILNG